MDNFDFNGRRLNVVAPIETANWIRKTVRPNIAVTFTLLQWRRDPSSGLWIRGSEEEYRWTFDKLVHRLSAGCFGKAYRRHRKLVPHAAVLEGEGKAKRFHIHAVFRNPDHVSFDGFIRRIEMHWTSSPWRMGDNKIEPITDDWTGYILKEGSEALLSAGGF